MGGRRIRGLKTMVGRKCCIGKGGARLNSGDTQTGGVREEVTVLSEEARTQQGGEGEAPGVRAAKSSEFR